MKRSYVLVVLTMVSTALHAACGGDPGDRNPGGGGTAGNSQGGGSTTPGVGPGGSECTPFCDGQALMGCQNGQTVQLKLCGLQEFCDDNLHDCNCTQGSKRCIAGNNTTEQVCNPDTGGKNGFDTNVCKQGEICINPDGCEPCDCECLVGDIMCGDDGDTVFVCQPNGSGTGCGGTCGVFTPNVACSDLGMKHGCKAPPAGTTTSKMEQFCINECETRGVPLDGDKCTQPPDKLCALLICNADGTELIPDHMDCRDGFKPCDFDEQCASCNCQNQKCMGTEVLRCLEAIEQCGP